MNIEKIYRVLEEEYGKNGVRDPELALSLIKELILLKTKESEDISDNEMKRLTEMKDYLTKNRGFLVHETNKYDHLEAIQTSDVLEVVTQALKERGDAEIQNDLNYQVDSYSSKTINRYNKRTKFSAIISGASLAFGGFFLNNFDKEYLRQILMSPSLLLILLFPWIITFCFYLESLKVESELDSITGTLKSQDELQKVWNNFIVSTNINSFTKEELSHFISFELYQSRPENSNLFLIILNLKKSKDKKYKLEEDRENFLFFVKNDLRFINWANRFLSDIEAKLALEKASKSILENNIKRGFIEESNKGLNISYLFTDKLNELRHTNTTNS